jgi:putative inorganic carbon (HCO3(-)) transporter
LNPIVQHVRTTPAATAARALAGAGRKVSFWVLAYVALLPYQYALHARFRLGIADVCVFIYLLLRASHLRIRRQAWSVWHVGLVLLFALGLFVAASRRGNLSQYEFLNKGVGLLILVATYAMITTEVEDWRQLRKVLRVFVLGVSFQNVFALAALLGSYLFGLQFSWLNYGNERLSGMLYDPNAYGGLLVAALACNMVGSSGAIPVTRGWLRVFCDLTLVLGIAFTFSRTAWMALAAGWIAYLVFRPKPALKMLAVTSTCVPVILVFIALGLLSPGKMVDRPDTIEQRMGLIDDSLAQFQQHPIVGMGLGGFRDSEGIIVHNTPLWFLVDFGMVGLGVFGGLMAWMYLVGFRTYAAAAADAKPYVLSLVVAHSAMLGLSMGIEGFYQRHWWLCFALIAAARTAVRYAPQGFAGTALTAPHGGMRIPGWRPALAAYGRGRA